LADKDVQYQIIDAVSVNLGRLIRYGALVWICRYVYLGVAVLAGRATVAEFFVKVLANMTVSTTLSLSFGATGLTYGWIQRQLRRRTIREKAARIKELEELLDPRRGSSGLMPDGSSRIEDGG
jgi:hypothetical protein